jgi:hypothetical protein
MRLPEYPRPGSKQPVEQSIRQIIDYLRAITVTSVTGGKLRQSTSGTTIAIPRTTNIKTTGGGSTSCPFGELITVNDESEFTQGIRGGIVYCGDKNFNVPYQGINLATSGVWLVFLEIGCESNRDDDNEIILPGIKTSAETDPSSFWDKKTFTTGTSYDDNTNPTVTDGLGTIIIPIGKLTVADGAASFERVGCGNVTIGQCAGILSHTRG